MKIFYLYILFLGTFFTTNAQEIMRFTNTNETSETIEQQFTEFKNLAFGSAHSLVFSSKVETEFESNSPIKRVTISNSEGLQLFKKQKNSYKQVEILVVRYSSNETYLFDSNIKSKLPNLKFIYLNSFEELTEEKVENITKVLQSQYPNVIIMYQTLINT